MVQACILIDATTAGRVVCWCFVDIDDDDDDVDVLLLFSVILNNECCDYA